MIKLKNNVEQIERFYGHCDYDTCLIGHQRALVPSETTQTCQDNKQPAKSSSKRRGFGPRTRGPGESFHFFTFSQLFIAPIHQLNFNALFIVAATNMDDHMFMRFHRRSHLWFHQLKRKSENMWASRILNILLLLYPSLSSAQSSCPSGAPISSKLIFKSSSILKR